LIAVWTVLARIRFRFVLAVDQGVKVLALAVSALGLRLPPWLMARLVTRAIAVRLMPSSLAVAARGRRVVLVTGTNGKTTTTALLVAALGGQVATNAGNHNFYCGLLDALLSSTAPVAVLEVDELWLPDVLRWLTPEVLLILNLLEDAWLRTPDPLYVIQRWQFSLKATRSMILAWAEDPCLVSLLADQQVHWISQLDQAVPPLLIQACPACGGILKRQGRDWSCRCAIRHPSALDGPEGIWQLSADGSRLEPPQGSVVSALKVEPGLPGRINRRNAAFATAAAVLMGVQPHHVDQRLRHFDHLPLRDHVYRLAGRDIQLLIGKNPVAWTVLLDRLEGDSRLILLQQQSAAASDLSWLYDIPMDGIRGRCVGICGAHALDLAVWLSYAQVDFISAADPRELVQRMPPGPLLCISDLLGAYLMQSLAD
jgi:hypothetical protein